MREIVLDIETTGLWINSGHRVIEVACIELEDYHPTGRIFHRYINPLIAKMPQEAFEIHGIPLEFLWQHAPFYYVADSLVEFIAGSQLIIHNAKFDLGFINNELAIIKRPPLQCQYIDTLSVARERYQNASNSLDGLCKRFNIDITHRKHHGALIDCALLATVYFELVGGRQPLMELPVQRREVVDIAPNLRPIRPPRPHPDFTNEELRNFSVTLTQIKDPIWNNIPY